MSECGGGPLAPCVEEISRTDITEKIVQVHSGEGGCPCPQDRVSVKRVFLGQEHYQVHRDPAEQGDPHESSTSNRNRSLLVVNYSQWSTWNAKKAFAHYVGFKLGVESGSSITCELLLQFPSFRTLSPQTPRAPRLYRAIGELEFVNAQSRKRRVTKGSRYVGSSGSHLASTTRRPASAAPASVGEPSSTSCYSLSTVQKTTNQMRQWPSKLWKLSIQHRDLRIYW